MQTGSLHVNRRWAVLALGSDDAADILQGPSVFAVDDYERRVALCQLYGANNRALARMA